MNEFKFMGDLNKEILQMDTLIDDVGDKVYFGIVDALGVETFFNLKKEASKGYKVLAHRFFCLEIRAGANTQRNAVPYMVKLDDNSISIINECIKKEEFTVAGDILTVIIDGLNKTKHTEINQALRKVKKLRGYL